MKRSITLLLSVLILALTGCTKKSFIDDTEFALYYKSIKPFTIGQEAVSKPSYIGEIPEDFQIYSIMHNLNLYYSPKIDGALEEDPNYNDIVIGLTNLLFSADFTFTIAEVTG